MARRSVERLDRLLHEQRQQSQAEILESWRALAQRVGDGCHTKQRGFVLDPGRRVAACIARGAGKTTGGRARLLRRSLLTRGARCLYVATTRPQAEELMWLPLLDLCEKLGLNPKVDHTKLKLALRENGSTIRLVGADNKKDIEKLRGQPFHEVQVDEFATHSKQIMEHLLFRIIGPRLGDYGGVLVIYGTPGHILAGPAYEATRPASEIARAYDDRDKPEFEDWHGWSTHNWSLQDGAQEIPAMARLWAEALVEKAANGWSDDNPTWRREYRGLWAADDTEAVFRYRPHLDDGTPWNQWDPEIDKKTGLAVLPEGHEWRYVYGLDLGSSDPFANEIFAYSPIDRNLYHVYEYEKKGMYAKTIAELLLGEELKYDPPGGLFGATGYPDGIVADTAGLGSMLLDELKSVYGISIEPAIKRDKIDAIELFNGDLIDGHIKILKGSKLEEQLMNLQWAIDTAGHLKEDPTARNDCTDAAIYARRCALHKFAGEPLPAGPEPGTPAALDRAMAEAEADRARPRGPYDELLTDIGYDDGAYEDDWGW